jgi:intracellular septation protein A
VLTWLLIVASAIAFVVLMWIPQRPMWVIIAVCATFVVGVLSLFFTAGDYRHNPNLDDNGTAV